MSRNNAFRNKGSPRILLQTTGRTASSPPTIFCPDNSADDGWRYHNGWSTNAARRFYLAGQVDTEEQRLQNKRFQFNGDYS